MSEYFKAHLCPCGWFDVPSFGNPWFSEKHYPVCPRCGSSCYAREMVVGRMESVPREKWWHLPKRRFAPKNTALIDKETDNDRP